MPSRNSIVLALVLFFYAAWVGFGLQAVRPPGDVALTAPLESADGGILYYGGGRVVAWHYAGGGYLVYSPGSWSLEVRGKPLAACSTGGSAAVALAAPDGGALFLDGGVARFYRASWIAPRALASCGGGTLAVGFSGEARSTLIVYRGGLAWEYSLDRLYGLAVDGNGTVYAAVGDGLLVLRPGGGAEMLHYDGFRVVGVYDGGRLVALDGGGRIVVAPRLGGPGLSVDDGNGSTRVEAATLDHGTVQAYVRPPAGWGRVACTTPGGRAYSLEAAATLPFAFTAAGGGNGTLWFSGILFAPNGKEMLLAVVDGCEPAMVPWPETIYYVKKAEPDPLRPATSTAPKPTVATLEATGKPLQASWTAKPGTPPSLEFREYHAYIDRAMIAFTLAAVAAAPAAAAYRAIARYDPSS